MPEEIQSIPLPNGWKIQTLGKDHISGFIHLIDPKGEIHTRIRTKEFSEKPEETALTLLGMFGEGTVNIGTEEGPAFEVCDGIYVGGSKEELWITEQHPTERAINYADDEEILYYHVEEWKQCPDEIINGFLVALLETIEENSIP